MPGIRAAATYHHPCMDGATILELLADSELFEGFAEADLDALAAAADIRSLRRN